MALGLTDAVAYQPDWDGGPHLKVAVHGEQHDRSIEIISRTLQAHLDQYGSGAKTTPAEYRKMQLSRGRFTPSLFTLRPNGVVELGDFTPVRPRKNAELGHLRDIFRSKTLELQFQLRRLWLQDQGEAIVELALHLMALEKIEWADNMNLWAFSILAHAANYGHVFDNQANETILHALERRLLSRLDAAGFSDGDATCTSMRDWIDAVQSQYDAHVGFWHANEDLIIAWGQKDAQDEPPIAVSAKRWFEIASAPRRVTYRHMVNDLYDLQLTSGMSVGAKLLACYTIDRVVRRHMPQTTQRVWENAAKM
jgi:hypothetical protein